jgi:arylsulfatase A-like enzyme
MRSSLLPAALVTIVALAASSEVLPRKAGARPNVVLLMTDDQGWADVGFQGHPRLRTPSLDEMARVGVRFERFYASSPVCSPTRASVLTGRHPFRMGITGANVGHLPEKEHTLAELLRDAGYATGHFGKWHLGTLTATGSDSNRGGPAGAQHYAPPWEHGFSTCLSTEAKLPTFDPMITPLREHGGIGERTPGEPYGTAYWTGPGQRVTAELSGDDSTLVMKRALAFIEEAEREERPFLAVVWFHAPHLPVVAGEEHCEAFADLPLLERHYLGCLSAVDENVGRLRRRLRELGIERETMIWFCSDNGPEGTVDSGLGSTGLLSGRKRSLREGGVRVPGIVEWPGQLEPARIEALAGTVDYLPTILSLLGLPLPDTQLDGVDLTRLMRGETTSRGSGMGFLHGNAQAWTEDRWKILRKGDDPFALFDLQEDPAESVDRSADHPERVEELARKLSAWRAEVEAE